VPVELSRVEEFALIRLHRPQALILESRIPAKRPGTALDVAQLVASLFGEDNAFLTGETIYLDGGQGMAH